MKAADIMSSPVATCYPEDSLHRAAGLMWEHDCGSIVVVDDHNRPVGVVTDRDICMSAWSGGAPLHQTEVRTAMAKTVVVCAPNDSVEIIHATMRAHQVHRIPVIDADGVLRGIISLADLTAAPGRATAKMAWETCAAIKRTRAGVEPTTILPAQAQTKSAPRQAPAKRGATKKSATKAVTTKKTTAKKATTKKKPTARKKTKSR